MLLLVEGCDFLKSRFRFLSINRLRRPPSLCARSDRSGDPAPIRWTAALWLIASVLRWLHPKRTSEHMHRLTSRCCPLSSNGVR